MLFEDETILRLFPVLRRSWSQQGQQAVVEISGRNAQRVLFCALNPKTGKRIVMQHKGMNNAGFQLFLQRVRSVYANRPIYMLLDQGGLHTAKSSVKRAAELKITLLWLPKQCPELNCVDQLWKSVKKDVSANKQYSSIELHAQTAADYVLLLSKKQALLNAGILADGFWLKGKL